MHTLRAGAMGFGIILALAASSMSYAVTVFTWVDAAGVKHFSQFPPPEDSQAVDTLDVESTAPSTTPDANAMKSSQDRLQTIRDVTRDLETSRQQREQQRAAEAAAAAEPPPVSMEPEPETRAIFVPYPYGMPSPHHHPPYRHPDGKDGRPDPDKHKPAPPRARIHDPNQGGRSPPD